MRGRRGKLLEVATAHTVAAFGVGAVVGDGSVTDRSADSLLAPARFQGGFRGVELGVEVDLRGSNQLAQECDPSRSGLLGAILPKRIGLPLRFKNEDGEPGREAVGQIETSRPRVGQATPRAAS